MTVVQQDSLVVWEIPDCIKCVMVVPAPRGDPGVLGLLAQQQLTLIVVKGLSQEPDNVRMETIALAMENRTKTVISGPAHPGCSGINGVLAAVRAVVGLKNADVSARVDNLARTAKAMINLSFSVTAVPVQRGDPGLHGPLASQLHTTIVVKDLSRGPDNVRTETIALETGNRIRIAISVPAHPGCNGINGVPAAPRAAAE